ncbi:MAG: hypothetical protein GY798_00500, partial [Hyphomicrobiales bacterium]|nr:hypothetical protein [Hyphomicrobiales bacterium]
MNGRTFAYLDFAALPAVGALLLDPRPAFVFRGDGSGVLWANAAGVAFLGAASMGALLARRYSAASPTVRSLARLAKSLSPDRSRLEILRFNFGVRQVALPSACRGLVLRDGARGLLAVATTTAARESLSTRSERLADVISGDDCLVAVLDREGGVLGASGGFDRLADASGEIDRLVAVAAVGEKAVSRASLGLNGTERQVGVARVHVGDDLVFLLIAGPAEKSQAPVVPAPLPTALESRTPADLDETDSSSIAIANQRLDPSDAKAEPVAARFLWQTDTHHALAFVSPDLGEAVGAGNAPAVGTAWRDVAERFGVDGDCEVANALSAISGFADMTLYWPLDDTPECVAIDLTGLPIFSRDGVFDGYRGFGVIRTDDRRPRTRSPSSGEPAPPPPVVKPEADTLPAEDLAEQTDVPPSNVVPLGNAPARILPKRLSGNEQDAFRRIAEALAGDSSRPLDPVQSQDSPDPSVVAPPFDQALLDRLPVGIAIYRDSQTLFANRPLLDWLGYPSVEAFAANGGADAIFPDGEDPSTTPDGTGALKAVRSDGTTIDVEARLHAVTWGGATALMLSL